MPGPRFRGAGTDLILEMLLGLGLAAEVVIVDEVGWLSTDETIEN